MIRTSRNKNSKRNNSRRLKLSKSLQNLRLLAMRQRKRRRKRIKRRANPSRQLLKKSQSRLLKSSRANLRTFWRISLSSD